MIARALVRLLNRVRRDEQGASMVVVAFALPVLILMGAFAVDAANWFVHKRHLQTQADSGALAAARSFQFPCGSTVNDAPNPSIIAMAHKYDGTGTGAFNPQVGNPPPTVSNGTYSATSNDVVSLVNAPSYFNQSTPAETDLTGVPCNDKAVDLKLTETNVPLFFKGLYGALGARYVNAQARVSLKTASGGSGSLPLAVVNPLPKRVTATVFDEASGLVLRPPFELTASSDGSTFSNVGDPKAVTFGLTTSGRVGVKFAVGGGTSVDCSGGTLVSCYDPGTSLDQPVDPATGVLFVRTWSNAGTPGQPSTNPAGPRARSASLEPVGGSACSSGSFTASDASCTVRLRADLEFAVTCKDVTLTLTAGGSAVPITCPGANSDPATGVWLSDPVTISSNSGPTAFELDWTQTSGAVGGDTCGSGGGPKSSARAPGGGGGGGGKACEGSFGIVQRIFSGAPDLASAGTSRSGPISAASVIDETASTLTSTRRCEVTELPGACTHGLTVTVSFYGLSNSTAFSDKAVRLALSGNQQNQSLNCGANNGTPDYQLAIFKGCPSPPGPYTENVSSTGACRTSPPLDCVNSLPGGKDSDQPFNARIQCPGIADWKTCGWDSKDKVGSVCVHPNYWTSPNTIPGVLAQTPADPRLVTVIVVPSGSIQRPGTSEDYPIRAFASFYVTGYSGSPCTAAGTDSVGSYAADDPAGTDEIVGHFVKYVRPGTTTPGSETCDTTTLGDCVAVLTK